MDDGAIFAGEDQGGLDSWAGGEVGEERSDMLRYLLCPLLFGGLSVSLPCHLKEKIKLTGGLAILVCGECEDARE